MMKISDLRNWAREEGIPNFSRMNKRELMDEWENFQPEEPLKIQWKKKARQKKEKEKEKKAFWAKPFVDFQILKPTIVKVAKSEIPKVISQQKEDWNAWLESVKDVEEKWLKRKLNPMVANMKKQINEIWEQEFTPKKSVSSLKEFVTQFTIQGKAGFSPSDFLRTVKPKLIQLLKEKPRTKVKMTLFCIMSRTELKTGDEIQAEAAFHSHIEKNFEGTNHNEMAQKMNKRILENFFAYQKRGSNWRFERIINLEIHFVKFSPLRAGTYMELPKGLPNKKAIVNLKNKDEKCFKYAVGRSLFPVKKNQERITKDLLDELETLDWTGISFPTPLKEINTFEKKQSSNCYQCFWF